MAIRARAGKRQALAIGLIVPLLLMFASGCGSGGAATQTWTIFVYGHGDHKLTGELADDITKMTAATLTSDVSIIVAADYNAALKDNNGVNYPTGTKWYSITSGAKTLIRDVPEQNLDDPAILTEAVTYAFTHYPATHYGVIMWDHGGSWDRGFGGDTQDGTLSGQQIPG